MQLGLVAFLGVAVQGLHVKSFFKSLTGSSTTKESVISSPIKGVAQGFLLPETPPRPKSVYPSESIPVCLETPPKKNTLTSSQVNTELSDQASIFLPETPPKRNLPRTSSSPESTFVCPETPPGKEKATLMSPSQPVLESPVVVTPSTELTLTSPTHTTSDSLATISDQSYDRFSLQSYDRFSLQSFDSSSLQRKTKAASQITFSTPPKRLRVAPVSADHKKRVEEIIGYIMKGEYVFARWFASSVPAPILCDSILLLDLDLITEVKQLRTLATVIGTLLRNGKEVKARRRRGLLGVLSKLKGKNLELYQSVVLPQVQFIRAK